MTATVTIVHPKHKPWQERLRRWLPALYERVVVANNRRKDARYFRRQGDLFDRLASLAGRPSHVEIETINRCNNTCAFCPVNRLVDPRPLTRMDDGLFRSIIDQLAVWRYAGVVNLFSNNEPFLDRRICDFASYARDRLPGAFLQVISNGTALDVQRVERILPELSRLIVNNYGRAPALNPSIAAIVAHLDAWRPELAGRTVVGLRLLDELKANRAGHAPNRSPRPTRFRSRCAYPFFQMVIRPDGKISLCCNDALGDMTLGDVSRRPLQEAWNSSERRAVQTAMLKGRDAIPLCAGCDNLSWAKPRRIAAAAATGKFTE